MNAAILRNAQKTLTVVPGDSYEGLTGKTACVHILNTEGRIAQTLLETDGDEPTDEVVDFFVDCIIYARNPHLSEALTAAGIPPAEDSSPVIFYVQEHFEGRKIRDLFAARFKRVIYRGRQ